MNVAEFLRSINTFDLLVVLFLFAFFVVGYIQGAIRRLLGIASILFSFLVAANLRDPLGSFLAQNWTQFPAEYAYMIGFGTVFVAGVIAFSVVIQAFYKKVELFERYPVVDEALGGVLGVAQGVLLLGASLVILDSFFAIQGLPVSAGELPGLRPFHEALDSSGTAALYRQTLVPVTFAIFGPLVPDSLTAFFPGT